MYKIKKLKKFSLSLDIPPDKSITHRAIILSSLCKGRTIIKPFLIYQDSCATLNCMKKLGIKVKFNRKKAVLTVYGRGMYFPRKTKIELYAAESGTTIRILSGLFAAQKIPIVFKAAPALARRPMKRIILPLREMGANISGKKRKDNFYPPLSIRPSEKIVAGKFTLPIASAQVKSAIILAGLYADKPTRIRELHKSRDHTECMLRLFKAKVETKGKTIISYPTKKITSPGRVYIPSDFSSAAFFIVLGLLKPESEILLKNISINPTRCGLLKVLKRMGAKVKLFNKQETYELYADIFTESSKLVATVIKEHEIASMIDEIPILCVAASKARGKTVIKGVGELKVKETDRLFAILYNLKKAGVKISVKSYKNKNIQNWMIEIKGNNAFKKANFKSFGDHRTAMSAVVLGSIMDEQSTVDDLKCINKSFPQFMSLVESLDK